jgi:dolichol-phosphate mannosyltransferase
VGTTDEGGRQVRSSVAPPSPLQGRDLAQRADAAGALLTVVTPAYNEAKNLPLLYERLVAVLDPLGLEWEWVVVDDHSSDETFGVLSELARADPRVRAVRLARNSGSHTAIAFGLHSARGSSAVLMAADLQDPPEVLPQLLAKWREGFQVVWAVRNRREGEKATTVGFSRLYYFLMRRVVGMREMPATGADFLLVDRRVLDAFRQFGESNVSVLALVTWMGFRQTTIGYDKQARVHGKSGWSLEKKLKLVVDSVTSFTYLPIRAMSYVGIVLALLGFVYAAFVATRALLGYGVEGWASLMVVVLVVGGAQMIMMGILGEYLWRALDESRRRPRFIVEAATPGAEQPERPPGPPRGS